MDISDNDQYMPDKELNMNFRIPRKRTAEESLGAPDNYQGGYPIESPQMGNTRPLLSAYSGLSGAASKASAHSNYRGPVPYIQTDLSKLDTSVKPPMMSTNQNMSIAATQYMNRNNNRQEYPQDNSNLMDSNLGQDFNKGRNQIGSKFGNTWSGPSNCDDYSGENRSQGSGWNSGQGQNWNSPQAQKWNSPQTPRWNKSAQASDWKGSLTSDFKSPPTQDWKNSPTSNWKSAQNSNWNGGQTSDWKSAQTLDWKNAQTSDWKSGQTSDWKSGQTSDWKNAQTSDWKSGQTSDWKSGQTSDWKSGQTSDWKSGQTSDWKSGQTSDWKSGQTSDWKSGQTSDWKSAQTSDWKSGQTSNWKGSQNSDWKNTQSSKGIQGEIGSSFDNDLFSRYRGHPDRQKPAERPFGWNSNGNNDGNSFNRSFRGRGGMKQRGFRNQSNDQENFGRGLSVLDNSDDTMSFGGGRGWNLNNDHSNEGQRNTGGRYWNKSERPKKPKPATPTVVIADTSDETLPKELREMFQPLFCKLCSIQMSSNVMAKLHYVSKNHEKKIRKYLIEHSEKTGEPLHPRATITAAQGKKEKEVDKDPKHFYCDICDLPLTGKQHAESHYMGKSHNAVRMGKKRPAGQGFYDQDGKWIRKSKEAKLVLADGEDKFGLDFRKKPEDVESATSENKPLPIVRSQEQFTCSLCSVSCVSQDQLNIHLNGAKHKKKLKLNGLSPDNFTLPENVEQKESEVITASDPKSAWNEEFVSDNFQNYTERNPYKTGFFF